MLVFSLFAVLLPLVVPASTPAVLERREVRCDIHLASSALKPGATGEIVLMFSPEEGIHINTDPAIAFTFDSSSSIRFVGITSLPKAAKTGYLDPSKPVRCTFVVNKSTKRGKHTLKGTVQYYFCSDTEGWCNRFSQPIELTFTVTP
jgi:hypothetical protein